MTTIPRPQRHKVPKLQCVIGDEVYDTETASVLHHDRIDNDDDDDPDIDIGHVLFAFGSVLLITVSNQYFVVDYNEKDGGSAWLRPVTLQEAVHWTELHCNAEQAEDIFGPMHEAGEDVPAYTPLPGPRKSVLKEWLRQQGKDQ